MPQVAITIAYDTDGNPSLLADPRTPAEQQRRQLALLKAGGTAPDGAQRIEFVEWNTGNVPCWISTGPAATKPITKKEKSNHQKGKIEMKKFILLLAGVALLCAAPAQAQLNDAVYAAQVPVQTNGNSVSHIALLAATATNLYATIDVRKQKNVEIQIVTTNNCPDAVNKNTLYYQRSIDNVNYDITLSPIAWLPNTNVAPMVITTNIDTFGCGFIRFMFLTNAAASGTNIGDFNLSYAIKIKAP